MLAQLTRAAVPADTDLKSEILNLKSPSTGPRTPEGKARSSQNALKHGLTSSQLPSDPEFLAFAANLRSEFRPQTHYQEALFLQIAGALWRLRGLPATENDLFEAEAQKLQDEGLDPSEFTPTQIMARCFVRNPRNSFILLQRYERALDNSLSKHLEQFRELQFDNDPDPSPNPACPVPRRRDPDPDPAPIPQSAIRTPQSPAPSDLRALSASVVRKSPSAPSQAPISKRTPLLSSILASATAPVLKSALSSP